MADEPRKRSRFDQTEPARKSRFDRRSRSPARGDGEAGSSRSPVPMESKGSESAGGKDVNTAAAAAAAAAAKINASISAKKGIQHVDVPPIGSVRLLSMPDAGYPRSVLIGSSRINLPPYQAQSSLPLRLEGQ